MTDYPIKPETKAAIDRYVQNGTPTGGFLYSVLINDLCGAVVRADEENRATLCEVVRYLYWEVPSNCWGSPKKVEDWKGLCPRAGRPVVYDGGLPV